MFGKISFQKFGDVAVHHGGVDQAGVHHLQDVFILEVFFRGDDFHRLLASGGEPRIQRHEAFVVGARRAHVDAAPGELIDRGGRRHIRRGDQDLADVLVDGGRREVDQLAAFRR